MSLKFLYDDEAPGPIDQLCDAASSAYDSVSGAVSNAVNSDLGQGTMTALKVGLVVGAAVALPYFCARFGENAADALFGK